jgi:hypothetical protein
LDGIMRDPEQISRADLSFARAMLPSIAVLRDTRNCD